MTGAGAIARGGSWLTQSPHSEAHLEPISFGRPRRASMSVGRPQRQQTGSGGGAVVKLDSTSTAATAPRKHHVSYNRGPRRAPRGRVVLHTTDPPLASAARRARRRAYSVASVRDFWHAPPATCVLGLAPGKSRTCEPYRGAGPVPSG